jgi:uncharacterized membrane protein
MDVKIDKYFYIFLLALFAYFVKLSSKHIFECAQAEFKLDILRIYIHSILFLFL